jgi:hypothetical protein
MTEDQLDALLLQPLAPVTDNGFSARVIAGVKAQERRHAAWIGVAAIAAATLACLLLPLYTLTGDFAAMLIQLGTSPMVALAGALLVLTYFIDRLYTDGRVLNS